MPASAANVQAPPAFPRVEIYRELVNRTYPSIFPHLIVLLLFGASTTFFQDYPQLFWLMAGICVAIGAWRFYLLRRFPATPPPALSRWAALFSLSALAMAGCWSALCLFSLAAYGWEWPTLALLVMTSGIAGGAVTFLCPHLRLAQVYPVLLFFPVMLAGLLGGNRKSLGLALTIAVFLVFLSFQARAQNLSFRASVAARLRAEAAEQSVRQSESRFRKIFDGNALPIWVFDRETLRFLEVNAAATQHYGYTREEFLGMSIADIRPAEEIAGMQAALHELEHGENVLGVRRHRHRDGRILHVYTVSHSLEFCGRPAALVIAQDVSELNRIKESLLKTEDRLRIALDGAQLGYWDLDVQSGNLEWGGHHFSLMGIDFVDFNGKEEQALGCVHPEDRPRVRRKKEECLESGVTYADEFRVLHREKGLRWLQSWGRVYRDESGRPMRMAGMVRDITAFHDAQEKLRHTLRELQNMKFALDQHAIVATTDPKGTILYANDKFCEISQYTREELVGKDHRLVSSGTHSKAFIRTLWQTIARGKVWSGEMCNRAKDGSPYWVATTIVPFLNDQGKPYQYVSIRSDITARIRSNQELEEYALSLAAAKEQQEENSATLARLVDELGAAKLRAEDATLAKSQFLANMSHEIRTPMNGVLGMAQLLMDTPLNPEQHEYVETIQQSADALLAVISDILDFSKIEVGKMTLEKISFSPTAVVHEIARLVNPLCAERGLALVQEEAHELPTAILGDPTRVRQVLLNLVCNAIKFTEAGSVAIETAVQERSFDSVTLRFSVRDTGIGIPQDKKQIIFDAFSQADSTTTRRYGGTGLGLTISARLVELMGGNIGVVSEPGKGSTFSFTANFELSPQSLAEPAEALADPGPAAAADPADLPKLSVLLAEDNLVNQRVVVRLLEKRGHGVQVASTGLAAVREFESQPFDVVLMDVQMPEMNGFEATAAIRALEGGRARRTPIVAMTAHAMKGDEERCLQAGMDAYVSKPVHAAKLYEILDRITAESRQGSSAGSKAQLASALRPPEAATILDTQEALNRVDGDAELYREALEMFLEQSPRWMQEVHHALETSDAGLLHRAAHTLKGSLKQLGARQAAEAAYHLEIDGRSGNLQQAGQRGASLDAEIARLRPVMELWMKENVHESCRR